VNLYVRFIPMVCIMGIIFYLSHQPGDFVQFHQFPGIDKLAHVMAYGCLAAAFLYSLQPFTHSNNRSVIAIIVILFCISWGMSDEFHQSFMNQDSFFVCLSFQYYDNSVKSFYST